MGLAKFSTKQFSAALSSLTSVPSQIAPVVAKKLQRENQRAFDAGVDPYGNPWAALKPRTLAKGRHPPPLTDTRKGRRSVKARATSGAGLQFTVGAPYMGIHQDGDPPRMVARRFLPWLGLPRAWRAIWQAELAHAVRARLRRG